MTISSSAYELLDFGHGAKLERFGTVVLSRPCPTAEGMKPAHPALWKQVTARYEATRAGAGHWHPAAATWGPTPWEYIHAGGTSFRLRLEALPSGQVGVFPEQRDNWDWIATQVRSAAQQLGRAPRVLNLFAYTGGSTLAAASAGAEVVHIDAASGIVTRARQNAELSGLAERPIRWIAEDAVKFCLRERKRGHSYDGVILDPPTYGHGPDGKRWQIQDDLLPLLKLCGELTAGCRAFMLVTCHSPGLGPRELSALLAQGMGARLLPAAVGGELVLATAAGRRLPSGVWARWAAAAHR